MSANNTEQLVTMRELEAKTHLNYWMIQKLAKEGKIPHIRIGKRVLFRLQSITEWFSMMTNLSSDINIEIGKQRT